MAPRSSIKLEASKLVQRQREPRATSGGKGTAHSRGRDTTHDNPQAEDRRAQSGYAQHAGARRNQVASSMTSPGHSQPSASTRDVAEALHRGTRNVAAGGISKVLQKGATGEARALKPTSKHV